MESSLSNILTTKLTFLVLVSVQLKPPTVQYNGISSEPEFA